LQEAAQRVSAVRFDSKHQQRGRRNQGDSAEREGQSCLPLTRLPADIPLFTVPVALVRILNLDLVAAGIARRVEVSPRKWKIEKPDERGRTVDVHALRHTFGTLLSAASVAPRTAQAAMRHSTIDLTMNVYTDPKLLDVAEAMESLPALSLTATPEAVKATGTDDSTASQLVPNLAPTIGKPCTLGAIVDKVTRAVEKSSAPDADAASAYPVKRKDPLTTLVNESWKWAALDSNQRLPPCEDGALTN
jgi:hypothetical protein